MSDSADRSKVQTWLQVAAIALSLLAMLVANERSNEATRQKVQALETRTAAIERDEAIDDVNDAERDMAYARLDEKLTYAIKLLEAKK